LIRDLHRYADAGMLTRGLFPLLVLYLAVFPSFTVSKPSFHSPSSPLQHAAPLRADLARAGERLMRWFSPTFGLWEGTNWWNSANIVEMLCEFHAVGAEFEGHGLDHGSVADVVTVVFQKQGTERLNTTSGSFDDIQWWALAWVRAAEEFPELQNRLGFLERSVMVWERVRRVAWDSTCGGGLWWSGNKHYKNAITNELFLVLSARLAHHFPHDRRFLDMARREWAWFEQSGLINGQHLINDGLRIDANGTCVNNGQTEWTYNQGVILGGLCHLGRATGNSTLFAIAAKIFDAASTKLSCPDTQILRESCDSCTGGENMCDSSQVQFKGIFARYIGYWSRHFAKTLPATARKWIRANADRVWSHDQCDCSRGAPDEACLGPNWNGPPCLMKYTAAGPQSSAMDVLVSSLGLHD
jgi:predicted alpha-1,6-mannanase (GH76 family)